MTALDNRCAPSEAATAAREARAVDGMLIGGIACALFAVGAAASTAMGMPFVIAATVSVLLLAGSIALVFRARALAVQRIDMLEGLADCDPATGCLNRRGFARALDETLIDASHNRREVSLLALDLDHFKDINDRYGHNVGDAVLFEVATTLVQAVGGQGVVARLGGEEFCVLLPYADAEAAGVLAERLLQEVRSHRLSAVTVEAYVTMSIGIAAERVSSVRDGAALRARADEALYTAKRGGRNRISLWAPGVRSLATPAAAAAAIVTPARWPVGGYRR